MSRETEHDFTVRTQDLSPADMAWRYWFLLKKRSKMARHARRERRQGANDEGVPVPPPLLRYRVHGRLKIENFAELGRKLAQDVVDLLARQDRKLSEFRDVLDFGCGCGRVLRYLQPHAPESHFHGCDIDEEAVSWCQQNYADLATFTLNDKTPPLPYADDSFDLVIGVSVFTHLDEDLQFAWLDELKRITRPGGMLILSVHSEASWKELAPDDLAELRDRGIALQRGYNFYLRVAGLPEFYQNAFHTREYLDREWSKRFTILEYVVRGTAGQDALVLRND